MTTKENTPKTSKSSDVHEVTNEHALTVDHWSAVGPVRFEVPQEVVKAALTYGGKSRYTENEVSQAISKYLNAPAERG